MNDNVNHPPHYKNLTNCDHCGKPIECINISRNFNFNLGNVIKYLWRTDKKGERLEQLQKAKWYLEDEINKYFPITMTEEQNINSGDFLPLGHKIFLRNCRLCHSSPICCKTNEITNEWCMIACTCYPEIKELWESKILNYLIEGWDNMNGG